MYRLFYVVDICLLQSVLEEVKESLDSFKVKKLSFVCRERKKPKVLRLYEPSIEEK